MTRSRSRIGSRVTTSASDNAFSGKTFYGGFIEFGWKAGKRVTNADLGVSRRKRRTQGQRAEAEARNNARKKIAGQSPLKRAADSQQEAALAIYRAETVRWIAELSK